ncbi:MAG: 1-deoxy-D-xylulose-5-phosphate reductoisomerase, partial [Pseudomonadota bacterium]
AGLEFHLPDEDRFPCLRLAREAIRAGRGANVVLNAANEVAVALFLDEKIGFSDIANVNAHVLRHCPSASPGSIADLQFLDDSARRFAEDYIANGLESVGLT